ncbi:MAG TPA: phage tail protein [Thermoanaerobaculia bacterium]|nr:phage tail protein [Thermoanaerobaculia bacterium]
MNPGPSLFSPFPQTQSLPIGVPVGTVVPYAGPVDEDPDRASVRRLRLAEQGWLLCDGSEVSKTHWRELYELIQDTYGKAGSADSFVLPDYRGAFLRGVNGDRSPALDPAAGQRTASGEGGTGTGNQVGSFQTAQFQEHEHQYTAGTTMSAFQAGGVNAVISTIESTTTAVVCGQGSGDSTSCYGAETRPVNIYVNYLIKGVDHQLRLTVPMEIPRLDPRLGLIR